eukprot:g2905.t1
MGNVHLGKAVSQPHHLLLDDAALPDHVFKCNLGYGKALKTTLCHTPQGPVIVKIFINRKYSETGGGGGGGQQLPPPVPHLQPSGSTIESHALRHATAATKGLSATDSGASETQSKSKHQSESFSSSGAGGGSISGSSSHSDPSRLQASASASTSSKDMTSTPRHPNTSNQQHDQSPMTSGGNGSGTNRKGNSGISGSSNASYNYRRSFTFPATGPLTFALPDLQFYERRLREIRAQLSLYYQPNVIPYQRILPSRRNPRKCAFLARQYFAHNLYDRISTRPFLTYEEKAWLTYQLLSALAQLHEVRIAHGDVKPENIMVTSWNWCFLTDIASYKPVYLPVDDPSKYYYFFENSGRGRACYLAPERFQKSMSHTKSAPHMKSTTLNTNSLPNSNPNPKPIASPNDNRNDRQGRDGSRQGREEGSRQGEEFAEDEESDKVEQEEKSKTSLPETSNNAKERMGFQGEEETLEDARDFEMSYFVSPEGVTSAMDIFSMGCVLSELFLEEPLFSLSELLSYRANALKEGLKTPTQQQESSTMAKRVRSRMTQKTIKTRFILSLVPQAVARRLRRLPNRTILELVISMIHFDPKKRITLAKLMRTNGCGLFPSTFNSLLFPINVRLLLWQHRVVLPKISHNSKRRESAMRKGTDGMTLKDTDSEQKINPDIEQKINPNIEQKINPDIEQKTSPNSEQKTNPSSSHRKRSRDNGTRTARATGASSKQRSFRFPRAFQFKHNCSNASDARIDLLCEYYSDIVKSVFQIDDLNGAKFFRHRLRIGAAGTAHVDAKAFYNNDDSEASLSEENHNDDGQEEKVQEERNRHVEEEEEEEKEEFIKRRHGGHSGAAFRNNNTSGSIVHEDVTAIYLPKPKTTKYPMDSNDKSNKTSTSDDNSSVDRGSSNVDRGTPNVDRGSSSGEHHHRAGRGAMVILGLVTSSLLHVSTPERRVTAIWLLVRFVLLSNSDEARLQRALPYLVTLFTDPIAIVRVAALKGVTKVLCGVRSIPPSDYNVFPDYIMYKEGLQRLATDTDHIVRLTFAECLPTLALTAKHFLDIIQATRHMKARQRKLSSERKQQSSIMSTTISELDDTRVEKTQTNLGTSNSLSASNSHSSSSHSSSRLSGQLSVETNNESLGGFNKSASEGESGNSNATAFTPTTPTSPLLSSNKGNKSSSVGSEDFRLISKSDLVEKKNESISATSSKDKKNDLLNNNQGQQQYDTSSGTTTATTRNDVMNRKKNNNHMSNNIVVEGHYDRTLGELREKFGDLLESLLRPGNASNNLNNTQHFDFAFRNVTRMNGGGQLGTRGGMGLNSVGDETTNSKLNNMSNPNGLSSSSSSSASSSTNNTSSSSNGGTGNLLNGGMRGSLGLSQICRTLLRGLTPLALFFGPVKTKEKVFTYIFTIFNNRHDWEVHRTFFKEIIPGVIGLVDRSALVEQILLFIELCLDWDNHALVTSAALECFTKLVERDLLIRNTVLSSSTDDVIS